MPKYPAGGYVSGNNPASEMHPPPRSIISIYPTVPKLDVEITWDYPGGSHKDVLPWPQIPIPSKGDYVYVKDTPFKVLHINFRPEQNWVHIVCGYYDS